MSIKENGDVAIRSQAHDAPLRINTGPNKRVLLMPGKSIDLFDHAERVRIDVVTRGRESLGDRPDVLSFVNPRIIEAR